MNFTELLKIVSNSDTGISFLQQHNIIKVSEVCENGHIMFIKGSRLRFPNSGLHYNYRFIIHFLHFSTYFIFYTFLNLNFILYIYIFKTIKIK